MNTDQSGVTNNLEHSGRFKVHGIKNVFLRETYLFALSLSSSSIKSSTPLLVLKNTGVQGECRLFDDFTLSSDNSSAYLLYVVESSIIGLFHSGRFDSSQLENDMFH